jgi:acetoacetyl-CoA synthetase
MSDQPLWSPSPERVRATQVMAFLGEANRRHQLDLARYRDLHAWSVKHPDLLWDFGGVIGEKGVRLAVDLDAMPGAKFFPDARACPRGETPALRACRSAAAGFRRN